MGLIFRGSFSAIACVLAGWNGNGGANGVCWCMGGRAGDGQLRAYSSSFAARWYSLVPDPESFLSSVLVSTEFA